MSKRSRVNTEWDYAVLARKYDGNNERLNGSGARTSRRARILDEGQIAAALRRIRETSNSPESDEVKFLLSVRAGLRAAEIAGLTMADVLNADGTIGAVIHVGRHIAKGGKQRMIPLHPQLKQALERLRAAHPDVRHVSFSKRRQPRRQSAQAVTCGPACKRDPVSGMIGV
jgi:integrase